LRLCAFTTEGTGSIRDWETKILHAARHGQKKKKKKYIYIYVCVCIERERERERERHL